MGKKRAEERRLEFAGRLTVHTIAARKRALEEAAAQARAFRLAFGAVDLSFFQLLCAFHRSALRDGKPVEVEPPVSPEVRKAMAGLGIERMMGCAEHGEKSCLWKCIGAADTAIRTSHDA